MTAPVYAPSNWYWAVATNPTQVYSSASVGYVALADATYVAWLAKGGAPTKISSEQSLWDVLIPLGIATPANTSTSTASKTAQIGAVNQVALTVLFNHENRIRTLEGKAAI